MRVITGSKKGTVLQTIAGLQTRPTTDRVKESIFNIIGPYLNGGKVLDLFAGSGGLGIEALSRGADYAVFIDKSFASIQIIKKNLLNTGLMKQAEVHKADWKVACEKLSAREVQFDYIFIDPPYKEFQDCLHNIIETLYERNLVAVEAIIVCEHDSKYEIPAVNERLTKNIYKYGNTSVSVYVNRGNIE